MKNVLKLFVGLTLCVTACSSATEDIESNLIPSSQSYVSNTFLDTYYDDIQYGELNIESLDIFIATPLTPGTTPVVFNFHGGGFISGNKANTYNDIDEVLFIENLLEQGVSFINVNYALLDIDDDDGVIKSLESARLAVQFILYHNEQLNVNSKQVILRGQSAGAGISMYLGYAPIEEESTNPNPIKEVIIDPVAVVLKIPQATYDIINWNSIFSSYNYNLELDYDTNTPNRKAFNRFYAIDSYSRVLDNDIIDYRTSVDMLGFINITGGVPTWLDSFNVLETSLTNNTLLDLLHNAYHGQAILNALVAKNTECIAYLKGLNYDDPSGENELEFIRRQLKN